ncbi:MAG: polyprenyl synthetase family protein, partial [Planctomycetaceae bacterium]
MTTNKQLEPLSQLLDPHVRAIEADIARWLVEPGCPNELAEAMRYSVMGGGKRLRPALVRMAAAAIGGTPDEMAARAATAVELVHCYSLVHDDLPAMDDDTLRRGRPTVHVQFGQAMAILVGDALLTRAFGVLAGGPDSSLAAKLVAELATAAGPAGMIAGQVADMELCTLPQGLDGLRFIHARKTGAMIRSACRMGAMCANADESAMKAISDYAEHLGLAFQVIDDVLDVTGSVESIGKTPGKDAAAGKKTYVSLLGL